MTCARSWYFGNKFGYKPRFHKRNLAFVESNKACWDLSCFKQESSGFVARALYARTMQIYYKKNCWHKIDTTSLTSATPTEIFVTFISDRTWSDITRRTWLNRSLQEWYYFNYILYHCRSILCCRQSEHGLFNFYSPMILTMWMGLVGSAFFFIKLDKHCTFRSCLLGASQFHVCFAILTSFGSETLPRMLLQAAGHKLKLFLAHGGRVMHTCVN